MTSRWSREDDDYLRAHPEASIMELARHLGRSYAAVRARRILIAAPGGLIGDDERRPWTPEEDAFLASHTLDPLAQTAAQLKRTYKDVRQRRRTLALETLESPRRSEHRKEIAAYLRETLSVSDTMQVYGYTRASVHQIADDFGILLPRARPSHPMRLRRMTLGIAKVDIARAVGLTPEIYTDIERERLDPLQTVLEEIERYFQEHELTSEPLRSQSSAPAPETTPPE